MEVFRPTELTVFYIEPLSLHGRSLDDFPDGDPPSAEYDALSNLVKQRSLKAAAWLAPVLTERRR